MEESSNPSSHSPDLQQALELAKSKRSRPGPDIIKPAKVLRDMRTIPYPQSFVPSCPKDGYPLEPDKSCYQCKQQEKMDEQRRAVWIERIGGPRAWHEYTLGRFQSTGYNYQALQAAKDFRWSEHNLLFYGPRGTGKSHMAAIAKRPAVTADVDVLTVYMVDVLGSINAKVASGSYGQVLEKWVKRMVNARVLSIEDMGVEKPSDAVTQFYYRVINGRYLASKKGMIVTINQSLAELELQWKRFDGPGRTVSRLTEMCKGKIFSLAGEKDWRAE